MLLELRAGGGGRIRNGFALGLLAAVTFSGLGCGSDDGDGGPPRPPNVLMIVTDDQADGTLARMPFLSRADGFTRFRSFYTNNPLCCPSRATLLTGLYSHHHGIETNLIAERFDDSSTLATWLAEAGYETGMFGKYLNEYPWQRGRDYVPPGWDQWSAFARDPDYFDYTLVSGDAPSKTYGDAARDYSTDVLTHQAMEFIRSAERPFFAYFAPYAPHAPRTAAPRDAGTYAGTPVELPPNFDRAAADAPRWWARRPPVSAEDSIVATRGQWESLLAVDSAVQHLLETLEEEGESERTIVVYLSDNGYALGSHRHRFKDCPYEECIRVPLLVRWPGHETASSVDALTANIDIAPTVVEMTGVATAPDAFDGESLVPLLTGEKTTLERPVLLRHVRYPRTAPSFWGLRTERWMYAVYETGERELYDLDADPYELRNLARERAYEAVVARLDRELRRLRGSG